jgi:hypothetical protein
MFTSLVTLGYQPYYCRMQEIITSKTGGRPYANMIKVGGIVVKFLGKTVRLKSVSATDGR